VLGTRATCADGAGGRLTGLVVRQAEGRAGSAAGYQLSYVVVEPPGRIAMGHLVPLALVHAGEEVVHLGCDTATFEQLPMAEASRLVPGVERTYGIVGSWYSGKGIAANDIVPPGHVVLHVGAAVESAGPGALLAGVSVDRNSSDLIVDFLVSTRSRWGRRRVTSVALAPTLVGADPGTNGLSGPIG